MYTHKLAYILTFCGSIVGVSTKIHAGQSSESENVAIVKNVPFSFQPWKEKQNICTYVQILNPWICTCKGIVMHSYSISAVISFPRLGIGDGNMSSMMVHCFKRCVIKILLSESKVRKVTKVHGYNTHFSFMQATHTDTLTCIHAPTGLFRLHAYKHINIHTCICIYTYKHTQLIQLHACIHIKHA